MMGVGQGIQTVVKFVMVSIIAFCFDTVLFLVRRSYEEDELMKKTFGKEWVDWRTRVPWRIIPFVI